MSADIVSRAAYDHLFDSGLTLSKIKDAALGGTLFHLDVTDDIAATGVPGRSLAWKVQRSRSSSPAPRAN
jgi:TBC1 domain family member 5